MKKVSCIIPVYNNEISIQHVLDTALSCDFINELIVIDDFSHDRSREILKDYMNKDKCKVIFNDHNMGKGGAVVEGIKASKYDILLLCDADLSRLRVEHLANLYNTFVKERLDMVIAARESIEGILGRLMGTISGERIFYKKTITKYLKLITECGNGIEQITNHVHSRHRVKMIVSQDIGHILKYERKDFPFWLGAYAKELYQVSATYLKLKSL